MNRTHGLLGLLILSACAAPAPTPKPPQPPGPAAAGTPRALVERLLQRAVLDGSIGRLNGTFVAREGARRVWITTQNVDAGNHGLIIRRTSRLVSAGAELRFESKHRFDPRGVYLGSQVTTSRLPELNRYELTVEGDSARVVETGPGGAETHTFPWGDDAVPAALLWELPRLFDRGLPASLQCKTLWRNGPARRLTPAQLDTRVVDGRCEARLKFRNDPEPITFEVAATGARRGCLERMESGGKARVYLKPTEVEPFLDGLEVLRNEWAAIDQLLELRQGPSTLPSRDSRGYAFAYRRSPAETKRWMAVASPLEAGDTGRYWFAITQDGTVYRSKTPLVLNDACAIPSSAQPVESD